jgi:hypothetical protein
MDITEIIVGIFIGIAVTPIEEIMRPAEYYWRCEKCGKSVKK